MQKALFAVAFSLIPSLPYPAAAGRLPSVLFIALLAVVGFVVPDLRLRAELCQHREAIFLDLPEAIAVMSFSLRAGQSLWQALDLAAKETPYVEFLCQQAAAARAEQARHLERAHDRTYLAMHAPLLAVLVLLVAYGFLAVDRRLRDEERGDSLVNWGRPWQTAKGDQLRITRRCSANSDFARLRMVAIVR